MGCACIQWKNWVRSSADESLNIKWIIFRHIKRHCQANAPRIHAEWEKIRTFPLPSFALFLIPFSHLIYSLALSTRPSVLFACCCCLWPERWLGDMSYRYIEMLSFIFHPQQRLFDYAIGNNGNGVGGYRRAKSNNKAPKHIIEFESIIWRLCAFFHAGKCSVILLTQHSTASECSPFHRVCDCSICAQIVFVCIILRSKGLQSDVNRFFIPNKRGKKSAAEQNCASSAGDGVVGSRKGKTTIQHWYRKLMIFTIYVFRETPPRVVVWRMIPGHNKQKYFHLSVQFDVKFSVARLKFDLFSRARSLSLFRSLLRNFLAKVKKWNNSNGRKWTIRFGQKRVDGAKKKWDDRTSAREGGRRRLARINENENLNHKKRVSNESLMNCSLLLSRECIHGVFPSVVGFCFAYVVNRCIFDAFNFSSWLQSHFSLCWHSIQCLGTRQRNWCVGGK